MKGKLVIFSAPSGAGKTTLVRAVLEANKEIEFSISACSREARKNEVNGKDYYFIGIDGFREKIREGAFLEWEEVYKDHYYGTLKSEVERIRNKGNHVIFDVDVYGGLSIKKHYGDQAIAIFIMPPSIETLAQRLRNRSTDSEKNIKKRLDKALHEIDKAGEFDTIIINDNLDEAIEESRRVVKEFLENNGQSS